MDQADTVGLGLFGLAVMIVLPVLLYPPAKAWLERRDHARRMSRAWREAQATGRPLSQVREQRSRKRRST
jgi:hypothetical protein